MVRSCDFDVHGFLREMDQSLEASRNVFRDFDARFQQISDDDWESIQLKVTICSSLKSFNTLNLLKLKTKLNIKATFTYIKVNALH